MSQEDPILVDYRGRVAIITLNVPKKLNALSGENYYKLARALLEVAEHDEVFITVLTGKGRFFSAYVSPHTHALKKYNMLIIMAI
jgi:peroxisomal 3,2-trans-enoyl-CoA isomerase